MEDEIEVIGGRIHNLKNINIKIPKNKLIVFTGVSGSGKSSLAFDLLFEEGRTRYLQAIGMPPRLESEKQFDLIKGLSPTIAIEQRTTRFTNPRSTVGTRTSIYNYLRMLYAIESEQLCPICKVPVKSDLTCDICGMKVETLQIKNFSFNEPSGMCLKCKGRGYIREYLQNKLVPNEDWTLWEICEHASNAFADCKRWMPCLAEHYGFDQATPFKDLPKKIKDIFFYGTKGEKILLQMETKNYSHTTEKAFEGIIPHLERTMERNISDYRRKIIEDRYMDLGICPDCDGYRINEKARNAKIEGKHIGELAQLSITELIEFLETVKKKKFRIENSRALINKILNELKKFEILGLSYLHLNRYTRTLSGGEVQRLSLIAQMSLGLENVILILDEPTMGMHEIEKENLGKVLLNLRDSRNSLLVVEHDESLMKLAEQIIDLGPGAGVEGGEIVFQGTYSELLKDPKSLTGKYLSNELKYPKKTSKDRRKIDKSKRIRMIGISTNNLKNLNVDIPLGVMVGVAGVSGSGKSSLISDTLVPLLQNQFKIMRDLKKSENQTEVKMGKKKANNGNDGTINGNEYESEDETRDPLEFIKGKLEGWDLINDIVVVDQGPIGRNRNSFPASYIGLWDYIRGLFAAQPLSKKRKYDEGHFSFNSDKGRCPVCKGEGRVKIQVSFLDDISILCEECHGQRYQSSILDVKYNGKNIKEILDLSVCDALQIFQEEPKITSYLKILNDIGMGYVTLGQSATTLSGGEAQRIKLSKALGTFKKENTLFILDEPSTGLHFHDETKLVTLLDRLVEQGNSVIIIEHNTKILGFCDYIIELGPSGGPKGGDLIACGTPEEIKSSNRSVIGKFL